MGIEKYNDIINMPHHTSFKHPRMTSVARAAQFSPFAALTGHDAAIKETARLTDRRIELSDCEKTVLDEKIEIIANRLFDKPETRVTYFVPDEKKSGGRYVEYTGIIKSINVYSRMILFEDTTSLQIDDIIDIDSDIFSYYCL